MPPEQCVHRVMHCCTILPLSSLLCVFFVWAEQQVELQEVLLKTKGLFADEVRREKASPVHTALVSVCATCVKSFMVDLRAARTVEYQCVRVEGVGGGFRDVESVRGHQ